MAVASTNGTESKVASDPEEGGQIASADGLAGAGAGDTGGMGGLGVAGAGGGGSIGIGSLGGHTAGLRGRASTAAPTMKMDGPKVKGPLDQAIVRRYLKRNTNKLLYCYERQLLARPGIRGKLTATYTIGLEGTVADAAAKGVDDEVATCVGKVLNMIEYPKPKDAAGTVKVSVTLTYAPAP